jgi:2'-5' RNA ligase
LIFVVSFLAQWRYVLKMSDENPAAFQRLFIAIPVPETVRGEISRAQDRLRRQAPPGAVRWTPAGQFHITLKFLGDVPGTQVAALEKSLAPLCAAAPALRLSARGIGFFPNAQQPRVIWVGAIDEPEQLAGLHRQIVEALRWVNPAEPPEKFSSHITLGRFKPGHHAAIPQLLELTDGLRDRPFGTWLAPAVELVRSRLTATGAEHDPIAAFPLAPLPPFVAHDVRSAGIA